MELMSAVTEAIETYYVDVFQLGFVLAFGLLFTQRKTQSTKACAQSVTGRDPGRIPQKRWKGPGESVAGWLGRFAPACWIERLRRLAVWGGDVPTSAANKALEKRTNFPAKACGEKAAAKGQKVGRKAATDPIIASALAELCRASRSGDLRKSEQCFEQLREAGHEDRTETFNQLIAAAARKGNTFAAERWFQKLTESGCEAGVITYDTLMDCHAKLGDLKGAEAWYSAMVESDISPRRITFQILINAAGKANDSLKADKWFKAMTDAGFTPDMITFTALIDAATRQGTRTGAFDLPRIHDYYAQMVRASIKPDVVVFTTLITAAAKAGDAAAAERWFEEMRQQGVSANIAAYTAIVLAHVRAGDMTAAEQRCFEVVCSPEIRADEQFFAVILDGYSKIGDVTKLEEWFDRMVTVGVIPTTISYAHTLSCFAKLEPCDVKRTIQTMRRMSAEGVSPHGSRCLNLARQALGDSLFRSTCAELGFNPNHHRWSRTDRERARERESMARNGLRRSWVEMYGNPRRHSEAEA